MTRYLRQTRLPEVGLAGQKRLRAASVLVVGVGGLGCPAAQYLAAAGVGRIGLVDGDTVDVTNLQRQVLYATEETGTRKVTAARGRLLALNPEISVEAIPEPFHEGNGLDLVSAYDVVLDGTDNLTAKYLLNDACVLTGKPLIFGSVLRFEGRVSVFGGGDGPCYRCLFPRMPDPADLGDCGSAGVLGAVPGVIGTLQATEALKLILGVGQPVKGKLLRYDALAGTFRQWEVSRDPDCALCGRTPSIRSLRWERAAFEPPPPEATLVDVREEAEFRSGHIPGALSLPLTQLPARWRELSTTKPICLYCRTGIRSRKALEFLREKGLTDLHSLRGGYETWLDNQPKPS